MISPVRRTAIDIHASVEKHCSVMANVLPMHCVTGCDTVATYQGIGKGMALEVLKSGKHSLLNVDVNSSLDDVLKQSTPFILSCYGHPRCDSITSAQENVARAHLQVPIMRHALEPNPPDLVHWHIAGQE